VAKAPFECRSMQVGRRLHRTASIISPRKFFIRLDPSLCSLRGEVSSSLLADAFTDSSSILLATHIKRRASPPSDSTLPDQRWNRRLSVRKRPSRGRCFAEPAMEQYNLLPAPKRRSTGYLPPWAHDVRHRHAHLRRVTPTSRDCHVLFGDSSASSRYCMQWSARRAGRRFWH
jgi:hypothetical protein